MIKKLRYLTTVQAALALGITRRRVNAMIGRLPAVKIGRDWLILQEDLDKFAAIPRKVGRPRKVKND